MEKSVKPRSSSTQLSLLFLEDHQDLAEEMIIFLQKRKVQVTHVSSIQQALAQLDTTRFDLLLLDRLLPDGDILDHYETVAQKHPGKILMMTALGQTPERIKGYQKGVDHYLPKPVDLDELLAIIQLQSIKKSSTPSAQSAWQIIEQNLICPDGASVHLTAREKRFLACLRHQPGQAFGRKALLEELYMGQDLSNLRNMDSMIYRLRQKVAQTSSVSLPVETYNRLGFVWSETL